MLFLVSFIGNVNAGLTVTALLILVPLDVQTDLCRTTCRARLGPLNDIADVTSEKNVKPSLRKILPNPSLSLQKRSSSNAISSFRRQSVVLVSESKYSSLNSLFATLTLGPPAFLPLPAGAALSFPLLDEPLSYSPYLFPPSLSR